MITASRRVGPRSPFAYLLLTFLASSATAAGPVVVRVEKDGRRLRPSRATASPTSSRGPAATGR